MNSFGWLDRLPRSSVRLGATVRPVHRLLAMAGGVVGVGILFVVTSGRGQGLLLVITTLGFCLPLSLLWARLRRWVTGQEAWVLLEHVYLAIGVTVLVSWSLAESVADLLDPLAVSAAFGFAIGRCGCLVRGCCYGVACRIGILYPPECHPGLPVTRRLPVQGIEATLWAVLGVVGIGLLFTAPPGTAAFVVLGAYAWGRLALEGLRADPRPLLLGLSESRWLSGCLLGGLVFLRGNVHESSHVALRWAAVVIVLMGVAALSWRWMVVRAAPVGASDPVLRAAALTLSRQIRQDGVHVAKLGNLVVAASHVDGALSLSVRRDDVPISAGEAELALSVVLRTMGLPDDLCGLTRSPSGLYIVSVSVDVVLPE